MHHTDDTVHGIPDLMTHVGQEFILDFHGRSGLVMDFSAPGYCLIQKTGTLLPFSAHSPHADASYQKQDCQVTDPESTDIYQGV